MGTPDGDPRDDGLRPRGELDDTYRIARVLLHDDEDLIHKAVGGTLRAADGVDRPAPARYLDEVGATMPRTMLRAAMEHFEPEQRAHYLSLRKQRA